MAPQTPEPHKLIRARKSLPLGKLVFRCLAEGRAAMGDEIGRPGGQ
jgi:hypothetical protein